MFSRWANVGLKAAEKALRQGRLDEALERLRQPGVCNHREAQNLVAELARPLLARARLHAQAGSYHAALEDLDRLAVIGSLTDDAKALRARVEQELRHRVDRHAHLDAAYQRAADNLKDGRLESGRLAIERLEDAKKRDDLREQLDIRIQRSAQLLEQAEAALRQGDVLIGLQFWGEACARHGRTQHTDALAARLVQPVCAALDEWLAAGRIDRLEAGLRAAAGLSAMTPAISEYERLAGLARRAAEQLARGDHRGLRDTLLRLTAARSGAQWVGEALQSCERMLAEHTRLMAGPLGLLGGSFHETNENVMPNTCPPHDNDTRTGPGRGAANVRGGPLLLLVDGTGSAMLLTRDKVRIGRMGASGVDVGIPADLQSHHADVLRDGEDYFLVAHGPVRVNRRAVQRTLLRDGDRIQLGDNAKLTFSKPSVKSPTAALRLGDRCRLAEDVSLVVLFKGTCLLGPQSSCHIRTREGDCRVVLFDRDGGLHLRKAARDGAPTGPATPVALGSTSEFGDLRLTVKDYA